jgi:hypothetical protein
VNRTTSTTVTQPHRHRKADDINRRQGEKPAVLTNGKPAPDKGLTEDQRNCKAIANKYEGKLERIAGWDESQLPSRDKRPSSDVLCNPTDPPRMPGRGVQ